MGIPKSMAVAVSGLALLGGAGLSVGAANSASAQTSVIAPQWGNRGCHGGGCHRGCCSRNHHRFRNSESNHWRNHERVIVINRNNNFSRSENEQFQRNNQRQRQRFQEQRPQMQQGAED
jgi:hypothetical protein